MRALKQSTQQKVMVGPLFDDTDFKTLETGVAYNAAGIDVDVIKSDMTKVDTTPAVGAGDWYWAHIAQANYQFTLKATDCSALGLLRVVFFATGVFPWWEDFCVLPANVYDSLVAGTDILQADVREWLGVAVEAGGDNLPKVDVQNWRGHPAVSGVRLGMV